MNNGQLDSLILSAISQSLQGLAKEHLKLDFKRQWYDLKDNKGIYEFLKDTCALANTPGGDGFIIIGFDEKNLEFQSAMFSDSGLSDSSELNGIVRKKVDPEFEINLFDTMYEEHTISVLHIPESPNKPHVLKEFMRFSKDNQEGRPEPHRIFIRKNTSVNCASRSDLDRMYRERHGEKEPDFDLCLSIQRASTSLQINKEDDRLLLTCNIFLENYGRKIAYVKEIWMDMVIPDHHTNQPEIFAVSHKRSSSSIRIDRNASLITTFTSISEKNFQKNIERQRFQEHYNQVVGCITYQNCKFVLNNGTEVNVEISIF